MAKLNVDTLLVGSFFRDGEDLRVTAQLIRVSTKEILWRGTIDVRYDRFPAVHDRVAREVVRGPRLPLSAQETGNTGRDGCGG